MPQPSPHLVKRYAPARLYDTTAMAYVDAAQLQDMARAGIPITVLDAATAEDLTATILRA